MSSDTSVRPCSRPSHSRHRPFVTGSPRFRPRRAGRRWPQARQRSPRAGQLDVPAQRPCHHTPPFQFSSIDDLAAFIEPGWWIATGDAEAYYHRFPLALLWRCLVGFVWNFLYWFFCVVPFGFGPSPYYCSGWSAECYRWVRYAQVLASVYMDDWATAVASHAAAVANMRAIKDLLEPSGILFNPSKDAVGQRVVYLGVLFDTIAMSLSFEAIKASVLLDILPAHHAYIPRGSNLPHAEIRSIAGKLSWFAQVLQSGRLHTRSW